MRRADRAVTDTSEIVGIIELCKTCHLAMADGDTPYVLPLSFGYALAEGKLTLYFHCAKEGKKLDILRRNPKVCFEMCREGEAVFRADHPCGSVYRYASVHGFGTATFLTDTDEKRRALSCIMERQTGAPTDFTPAQANAVCVFRVDSADFTGKRVKPPAGE